MDTQQGNRGLLDCLLLLQCLIRNHRFPQYSPINDSSTKGLSGTLLWRLAATSNKQKERHKLTCASYIYRLLPLNTNLLWLYIYLYICHEMYMALRIWPRHELHRNRQRCLDLLHPLATLPHPHWRVREKEERRGKGSYIPNYQDPIIRICHIFITYSQDILSPPSSEPRGEIWWICPMIRRTS